MVRPPAGRLVALLGAMILAFVAISARLAVLQLGHGPELQERALAQRVRTTTLPAQRGEIVDRDGERLAVSIPAMDVYADPQLVTDPRAVALQLAPVVDVRPWTLASSISSDEPFVYVARQMPLGVAERIADLGLPGIGLLETSRRSYPAGTLAAHVLGFVGTDGEGLSGLELAYQDELAGTPGERVLELGLSGQPIVGGVDVERSPVQGSTIVTTLDRELQFQAEVALAEMVQEQGARGGTVIAMDARTFEILAMASIPSFDPNAFQNSPQTVYRNRAVTDAYEPGSTNKVITAAAAIEERAFALDRRFTVPWQMRVGTYTIHDSHPHPELRMTLGDIVAQSSNIGAVQVAEELGAPALSSYLARFGLGRATGVGFPGEADGILLPLSSWTETSLATMAYGQGIAATPLQMACVYATIANGGRSLAPSLVRGVLDPDGTFHPSERGPARRVVSPSTARMVTRMLAYAVDHGTGTNARIAGFQVAGKTGTARIPAGDGSGYLEGEYIASFIGFLPARDPEIVIAAIVDRPVAGYGSVAAAPLFRRVAMASIATLGIAPARPLDLPPHAMPVP